MSFLAGFTDELTKLADDQSDRDRQLGHAAAATGAAGLGVAAYAHKNPEKFKKFVNSEAGAMYAGHLPGGGAALGFLRGGDKGGNLKSRLKDAGRGMAGEAIGNAAGGTAGLGAGLLAKHVLQSRGINAPGWLVPTATAIGGLAVGPALMHRFTHV